jgi:hypothetical protein
VYKRQTNCRYRRSPGKRNQERRRLAEDNVIISDADSVNCEGKFQYFLVQIPVLLCIYQYFLGNARTILYDSIQPALDPCG